MKQQLRAWAWLGDYITGHSEHESGKLIGTFEYDSTDPQGINNVLEQAWRSWEANETKPYRSFMVGDYISLTIDVDRPELDHEVLGFFSVASIGFLIGKQAEMAKFGRSKAPLYTGPKPD